MATLCCCPTASLWWVITFPPADGLAAWKGSVSGHVWPCVCVCSLPACLCAWFMSADLRMSSVSLPHRRLLSQAAPLWVLDQDGHSGGTEPTRDSLELELIFTTHFMVEWKHCQGCQVFKNTMGFVALFPLLLQCTALKKVHNILRTTYSEYWHFIDPQCASTSGTLHVLKVHMKII